MTEQPPVAPPPAGGEALDLATLLAPVDVTATRGPVAACRPRGLAWDSRRVAPGDLFFCLPGAATDGHDHAAAAVAAGAVALVVEHLVDERLLGGGGPGAGVAQAAVADARLAMALVASAFHGHPSRRLDVVGVTGTNGKTTVAHLLGAVLTAAGRVHEVIGTLTQSLTTPEAPELTARLARLVAAGGEAAAMEVSSHALVQRRVAGTSFAVAVFTNLSEDHLDFHPSMEAYYEAKASLFDPARVATAVIGTDDAWGRRLAAETAVPVVAWSLADAEDLRTGPGGSVWRWRGQDVRLRLPGLHNVANAVAASTAAEAVGVQPAAVTAGLAAVVGVPGRFELVDGGQPFAVIVDFAHTPAALAAVLEAARGLTGPGGRVVVAFGCGGDRDRAKRALMGAAAAAGADVVVVTSDNPRSEDPASIAAEVLAGVPAATGAEVVLELDRAAAIALALGAARPGDAVVVAGKGHEVEQVEGDRRRPFDDRRVAAGVLARLGHGAGGR